VTYCVCTPSCAHICAWARRRRPSAVVGARDGDGDDGDDDDDDDECEHWGRGVA